MPLAGLDATLVAIFLEMTIDTSLLLPIWHNQFMAFLTLISIAKTALFFASFLVYSIFSLTDFFTLSTKSFFFFIGRFFMQMITACIEK